MILRSFAKGIAYGMLDLLTARRGIRRTVDGESLRFPTRWFRYYPDTYEPATAAFLRVNCRPGDIAVDIGAHIGLYSVLMARAVGRLGRVFSFEPTPLTRAVLEETVRLNGCEGVVEVRGEAVAGVTGTAVFYDATVALGSANSLVAGGRQSSAVKAIRVQTVSVDEFVRNRNLRPRCLKIDAEGAELDILLGAEKTLVEHRPMIDLALHPTVLTQGGGSLRAVWNVLRRCRMAVRREDGDVSEDWFCGQEGLFNVHLLPE